jgi:hypothetical protein
MVELVAVAVLALHGIVCSMILVVYLWRAAKWREARWSIGPAAAAPDKLEPPDLAYFAVEGYSAPEIFAIMREYFPTEYERYHSGRLGYIERRWTWDACCSILEARAEIEELCS